MSFVESVQTPVEFKKINETRSIITHYISCRLLVGVSETHREFIHVMKM